MCVVFIYCHLYATDDIMIRVMLTYGCILNVVIQHQALLTDNWCRGFSVVVFFISYEINWKSTPAFHLLIKVHHIFHTAKMHNDTLICELLLLLCNCTTLMQPACVEHVSMQATDQSVYTNISIASVISVFQELHLFSRASRGTNKQ